MLYVAALWSHWDKHVLGWWKHRDDANVLFLKYEDLLKVCNYIERLLFSSFQLFLNKFITFLLELSETLVKAKPQRQTSEGQLDLEGLNGVVAFTVIG